MLVVEFTDGITLEAKNYEQNEQGLKLYGTGETLLTFAPHHSVRYMDESSASQTPPSKGNGKGGSGGTQ